MTTILPSRFQLGDMVRVAGRHAYRPVTGICFRAGKVSYEVAGQFFNSDDVHEPLRIIEAVGP